MAQGQVEADAIEEASQDATLDRYLAIAPIRDYALLPERRQAGVRTGQRHGTFPVPSGPAYDMEAGWVDLNAPSTVDRAFFSPDLRVAALSNRAADYLRAALRRHWSYRDWSRVDEVSRALGRTIVDIKVAPTAKEKLRLELLLDGNAGTLTLEGSSKPAPPARTARRRV